MAVKRNVLVWQGENENARRIVTAQEHSYNHIGWLVKLVGRMGNLVGRMVNLVGRLVKLVGRLGNLVGRMVNLVGRMVLCANWFT